MSAEIHGTSSPGSLDEIGVRHRVDLSSLSRDYLRTWERVLAPLRDQAFDLLQLGIGTGASLRTWREAFPNSRLVGLDARRLLLDPPIANCTLVLGRQTDLAVLQPLLRDYRFRLIVDDASRHPDDQVQTFLTLFPWLEPDSVYICAGLDEPLVPFTAQQEKPGEPPRPPARLSRASGRKAERPTGLAWFAELGRALTECDLPDRHTVEQAMREFTVRKASSVVLLRGSVVVTS